MKNIYNFLKENLFFSFIFLFITLTFYRYLYFQLEDIDEINYLSDSLLLIEGIMPSFKHSPSGISTWIGSIFVFIEFFFYSIFKNLPTDVRTLFENFDYIIFKNYLDLTNIKITLFILNLFLIFYLYKNDKENKLFFYLFLIIFFCPYLIDLTFSGKPYFTASLFCALSFAIKDKNKTISHILFGLALAEKLEFILLINFFAIEDKKFYLKNYILIFLVFFAAAPWWTISFFQNIKTNLHFVLDNISSKEEDGSSIINSIFFLFYFFGLFFINFLNKKKYKLFIISLLFISMLQLLIFQFYYLRWFQPLFVYFVYILSTYRTEILQYNKLKKIILLIPIIFLLNLNTTKIIAKPSADEGEIKVWKLSFNKLESDLEILELEKKADSKNVISHGLLKEDLDFKDYVNEQMPTLTNRNIKNNNHFNDQNSPISFSVSGNLELSFIRRYEYIAKYHSGTKNKLVIMGGGIPSDVKFWCSRSYIDSKSVVVSFGNRENISNCKLRMQ